MANKKQEKYTEFIGVNVSKEQKAWAKDKAHSLGLMLANYIRSLICTEMNKEKKQ